MHLYCENMRIITGKYKGRHFDIPRTFKARPTTDFAKENIFNVLMGYIDLDGADALDLFAGTGSISLELLSRGCRSVICIEQEREHYAFIRQCINKLNDNNIQPIRGDVFRFIKSCKRQFDFVFADPPYTLKELPLIPGIILSSSILRDNGIFVFEHGKNHQFQDNPHFIDHREYGAVNFSIFQ